MLRPHCLSPENFCFEWFNNCLREVGGNVGSSSDGVRGLGGKV